MPFSTVHLRFTYAADILTSLNRVFVHFIFSGCYFATGAFLYAANPRNEHASELFAACTTHPALYAFKVFIQIFPYYIRMMQCLRQRRDHFLRQELVPPVLVVKDVKDKETPLETIPEEDGAVLDDTEEEVPKLHSRPSYVSLTDLGEQEDTAIKGTSPSNNKPHNAANNIKSNLHVNEEDPEDEYAVCYLEDREQFTEYYDHDEDPLGHSSHFDQDNIEYEDHDHSPLALPIRQSPSKTRLRALSQGSNRSGHSGGERDYENQRAPSPGKGTSPGSYLPQRTKSVGKNNRFAARRAQIDRFLGEGRSKSNDFASFLSMIYATIMVWPYSYNALRYFLSILVIFFGAFPPSDTDGVLYRSWYIPLYVIATLFSCYWDVAMDFQLMQFNCKKPFLRSRLFYEETEIFYYVVLVLNPILRFMWTLNFTPFGGQPYLVIFEIARRSMWACLRMELGYIQELERRK